MGRLRRLGALAGDNRISNGTYSLKLNKKKRLLYDKCGPIYHAFDTLPVLSFHDAQAAPL